MLNGTIMDAPPRGSRHTLATVTLAGGCPMRVLSCAAHDCPMEGHDGGTMSLVLKILLGAVGALVLVSAATGLVAASGVDDPAPRETIVVDHSGRQDARDDDKKQKKDDRDDPGKARHEKSDDHGGDDADDESDDDIDTAQVEPDDFDDDDDNSGPGGGDDRTDDHGGDDRGDDHGGDDHGGDDHGGDDD
ncbi:hypothetical protein GCM10009623_34930 [Nocardioides aestuarii]